MRMVGVLTEPRAARGDHHGVGRLALVLVVGSSSVALADDVVMDQRWPAVPLDHRLTLEDQITDHLTDLGNAVGGQLDLLSHDLMGLHVDGRANRARLRLGGGNVHYLTFRIDSDWHFGEGKARVKARLELGLAGHVLELKLPDMEVIPDSYRGDRVVDINVPLLERRF